MRLTWLGHSCFLLEQDGYTILLDPYTGVDGYPPLSERGLAVNEILCSHEHGDHHAVDQAALLPGGAPSPFDGQGGALRGSNTVRVLSAGGVTVAHMGDLGHPLSPEQAAAIGPLDALLIPVGGYYTIGAAEAKAVCSALRPRCVLPMHYRLGTRGYPVLAGVEDFLALWPAEEIRRLDGPALDLDGTARDVIVPRSSEEV